MADQPLQPTTGNALDRPVTGMPRPGSAGIAGFARYDFWIGAAVLVILAAAVIPGALRGVRQARLRRALRLDLVHIAQLQDAHYQQTHAYLDSLPVAVTGANRVLSLQADSTGWAAVLTTDSLQATPTTCAVFDGDSSHAPDARVTQPRRIACW